VDLELDDVVKHSLDFGMKLFSERVGAEIKLLVSCSCQLETRTEYAGRVFT